MAYINLEDCKSNRFGKVWGGVIYLMLTVACLLIVCYLVSIIYSVFSDGEQKKFYESVATYNEQPSAQKAEEMVDLFGEYGFSLRSAGEDNVMAEEDGALYLEERDLMQEALYANKHDDSLGFSLYKHGVSDAFMEKTILGYMGSDGAVLNVIANRYIRNNQMLKAYGAYIQSLKGGYSLVPKLVAMLGHFGCLREAEIFRELHDRDVHFLLAGAKYPAIKNTMTDKEMVVVRVNLRKGIIPKLTEACPINLYSD